MSATDSVNISAPLKQAQVQIAETIAIGHVLKALIVTHPDRKSLRLAIETLSNATEDDAHDYGFEASKSLNAVHNVTAMIENYVNRWLELLDHAEPPTKS